VEEAAAQQQRDAANRKGMSASLLAGETGGNSATGANSLLGQTNTQKTGDPIVDAAWQAKSLGATALSTGMSMYGKQNAGGSK